MTKKILAVLAAAAIAFNVSAQSSARIDAMGGAGLQGDMSDIQYSPAWMNDYSDQIQGTMMGQKYSIYSDITTGDGISYDDYYYYGNIIGVKSIGEMLNLGTWVPSSGSATIRGSFLDDANTFLSNSAGTLGQSNFLPADFLPIPHILLGVNLDAVKIGLDLFFENTSYKYEGFDKNSTPEITTTGKEKILNAGGRINAIVELGPLYLSPAFTIYLPRLSAEYEYDSSSSANAKSSNSITTEGAGINAALEMGMEVGDGNVVAGFGFTSEKYKFKTSTSLTNTGVTPNTTVDTSFTTDQYKDIFFDIYAGYYTELANDLLVSLIYNLEIYNDIFEMENSETKDTYLTHYFAAGVERPFECKKFLNNFIPRCGFSYYLSDYKELAKSTNNENFEEVTKNPADEGQINVTAGFGLEKGIATFDVACNIGSWSGGTVSGPDAFNASITLDFKKNSKVKNKGASSSADSYSAPAPSYESTPASTYESTPATEGTTDDTETSGGSFDF